MLNGIWNGLRGSVRVWATGPRPERVFNLCAGENLAFWDLRWETENTFTCRMSLRDWRTLRRTLERPENADPEQIVRVAGLSGLPYFAARLRERQTLAFSLILGGTALFLGSFFIWDFQMSGNETVPETRILRALEREGVGLGTFGLTLDGENLRNRLLLDLPELQWIAVNVSGCRANVRVVERIQPPEIWDRRTPANVLARRDGLVLEVHALDGVAAVLPGTSVTEGDLLISGTEDLETTGAARIMAGYGSVLARTWHTLSTTIPLETQKKQYTGRIVRRYALMFGRHRITIRKRSGVPEESCDKTSANFHWNVLGIPMPVSLTKEEYRFYETVPTSLSAEEAQKRGERILREALETEVASYGEIRSVLCSSRRRGDTLDVTLRAECVEEIAVVTPLYADESANNPAP